MSHSLKLQLHQACTAQIEEKIADLERAIRDAQQAASDDTKSSAGDKYETSREMMKLEMDKYGSQLSKAADMLKALGQISPDPRPGPIGQGSLVTTDEGVYYLSVSLGKVRVGELSFFALSPASPIGQALQHRRAGEEVVCMGRRIRIVLVE
ncbi:MAG: 3-oxoacyl-ACP synthase [Bacteroidetes bacterium]|nr:MAG: 3-oxoacyl-ACP synthase [Bacteroidota bacterium]